MVDASVVLRAFDELGGDPSTAVSASRTYTSISTWKAAQAAQSGAAGAVAVAVPVLHLPALVADVCFLLHKMAYCSWGIGEILGAEVEGKPDFALILQLWANDLSDTELPSAILASTAAGAFAVLAAQQGVSAASIELAGKATGKVVGKGANAATIALAKKMGAKTSAKTAGKLAGTVSGRLAEKAATKIAAKLGTKLAAKGVAGFIPLVGPAISGGVNVYFLKDIGDSAERYYRTKRKMFS